METTQVRRRIVGHRSEVIKRPVKFFYVYPEDLETEETQAAEENLCMQGNVRDVEEDVASLFNRLRIAGAY